MIFLVSSWNIDFLHAFFSTISYNLEENKWGSKYSILMNELYQGKLNWENASKAVEELKLIKEELKLFYVMPSVKIKEVA